MSRIIERVSYICDVCCDTTEETNGGTPYGWYVLTDYVFICPECIRMVHRDLTDIIQDYPIKDNTTKDDTAPV